MQRALRMQIACLPATHSDLADTYFDFGCAYQGIDKLDSAIDYYTRALKIQEISLPVGHANVLKTQKCLQHVNEVLAKNRIHP